ncbi:MAG: hypothetical protein FJ096_20055 [Deltaproteobacteria bacterium]|nr:hypothetical protein [Deltaproteobacteria bacterium]
MTSLSKRWFLVLGMPLVAACGDTGQREVRIAASAFGVAPAPIEVGQHAATLEVARIGFGPVYFCATAGASSDLCPTAQAELTQPSLVDGLETEPAALPSLLGVTGTIRSASYDFGVTWLAVEQAPTGHLAQLGRFAAHFEGTVRKGEGPARAFVADVEVRPQLQGSQTVNGAQTFVELEEEPPALAVAFDPNAWWATVDLAEFDGFEGDPIVVPVESRAHSALVAAMTATRPPSFTWTPAR